MSVFSRLIQDWQAYRRYEQEVASFPQAELDGMGLSRSDFQAVAHMPPEQVTRMEQMAEVFGLDLAKVPDLRIDVARRCAGCEAQGECRHALADPAGATPESCGFCPNAATFAAAGDMASGAAR